MLLALRGTQPERGCWSVPGAGREAARGGAAGGAGEDRPDHEQRPRTMDRWIPAGDGRV